MKAAVCTKYGSARDPFAPDALRIADVDPPRPARNQALIRVRAAAVNPLDVGLVKGRPAAVRLVTGLRRPTTTRPGVDFAGEVLAVGPDVRRAHPGEEVFGVCVTDPHARGLKTWAHHLGSFADLLCVTDSCFVPKPPGLTFEEAAAVPIAALTALQGLRDHAKLEAGQSVLVNGAAGGVGTFAVQLALFFGAEVTAVCGAANAAMVRALGAHHTLDYTRDDFTRRPAKYDVLFDCVGNHPFSASRRVLRPGGVCVAVGQMSDAGLVTLAARLGAGLVLSRFTTEKLVTFLARPSRRDLLTLSTLLETGAIESAIDRCYSLDELPDALRYVDTRHAAGKVVIRIGDAAS